MSFRSATTRLPVILLAAVAVSACKGDMSSLESYIHDVKQRPGQEPEPLPEVKRYTPPAFVILDNYRTPFASFEAWERARARSAAATSGPRPVLGRQKEHLEQFPLDSLSMMGTLEIDEQVYALVRTKEPRVYKVQVGDYIGLNHGQIIRISQSEVMLSELVTNELGGWDERQASVALNKAGASQSGDRRR